MTDPVDTAPKLEPIAAEGPGKPVDAAVAELKVTVPEPKKPKADAELEVTVEEIVVMLALPDSATIGTIIRESPVVFTVTPLAETVANPPAFTPVTPLELTISVGVPLKLGSGDVGTPRYE
jgi:hypothetical protein